MQFHLMIVDDEPTIRKGLSSFIDWNSIGCTVDYCAVDGNDAIEHIQQQKPDIIISDIKMPDCDGISLAKYVYENHQDIKVILLTGYADFEYAQTAIRYRVLDFILKPTSRDKLIASVKKAQTVIISEQGKSSLDQAGISFMREQLFQELTGANSTPANMTDTMITCDLAPFTFYLAAIQNLQNLSSAHVEANHMDLKKQLQEYHKESYIYQYNNLIIWLYPYQENHSGNQQDAYEEFYHLCNDFTDIVYSLNSVHLSIGISACHRFPEELSTAYVEAFSALNLNFYKDSYISQYEGENQTTDVINASYTVALYDFENHLQNMDFQTADTDISHLFNKLRLELANPMDVKNLCSQIYYILGKLLTRKELSPLPENSLQELHATTTLINLESQTRAMLSYVREEIEASNTRTNSLVSSSMEYIEAHLTDSLSLESISSAIHVNPSYLSRIFKRETGIPLTEHINLKRIERAKVLLQDGNTLSYKIAEEVGYNDPAYFSSIFKKYTGMSPKEYKQKTFNHS